MEWKVLCVTVICSKMKSPCGGLGTHARCVQEPGIGTQQGEEQECQKRMEEFRNLEKASL